MGVTQGDFLHLPFSGIYPAAGIQFIVNNFHQPAYQQQRRPAQLRHAAQQAAVELAIGSWLQSLSIPFGLQGVSPLSNPNHRSMILGGRQLHILLIPESRPPRPTGQFGSLARLILPDPGSLSELRQAGDPCLYTTFSGANHPAPARAQPVRRQMITCLPARYHPSHTSWQPYKRLFIASAEPSEVSIRIHGLLKDRSRRGETIRVPADQVVSVRSTFYDLVFLEALRPSAPHLLLRCAQPAFEIEIVPGTWENLWFEAERLVLLGWNTLGALQPPGRSRRRRSGGASQRADQAAPTALSLADLRPVTDLLARCAD